MHSRNTFAATTLDRESLSQNSLDIAKRVRTNPFPWKGQFSPQLVEELLSAYAPQGGVVLDPFIGSGTSLVEAARFGLGACGCDINPAALILARVYKMANQDANRRAVVLEDLRDRLFDLVGPPHGPLFFDAAYGAHDRAALEGALVKLWCKSAPGPVRDLAAALIVLCDFHCETLGEDTVYRAWFNLEKVVHALPESRAPVAVHHADARALPVESNSVDLVITSPPYINVHNYHQKFRRSVEAMGWDVLAIARAEIGSNRQNRGNRFLTVIQYSLDMALALREMARAAKSGTRLILVLGRESTVRGTRFFNGELVTEIAVRSVGMEIERRQERVFRNRYGMDIYEDILHFRSNAEIPDENLVLTTARRIAGEALLATRPAVPREEYAGIEDAMARLDTVLPSSALIPTVLSEVPA